MRLAPFLLLCSLLTPACSRTAPDPPPRPAPVDLALAQSPLAARVSPFEVVDCPPKLPPEPSEEELEAWCSSEAPYGTLDEDAALAPFLAAQGLPPGTQPSPLDDLDTKNRWDAAFRAFARSGAYLQTGWTHDRDWRLTGPTAGPMGGEGFRNYGVHPGVRIWYSPKTTTWLCGGRQGALPDGAILLKEMVNYSNLGPYAKTDEQGYGSLLGPRGRDEECFAPPADAAPPGPICADSWAVMVKDAGHSWDGHYWSNPWKGETNPPVAGRTGSDGTAGNPDSVGDPTAQDRAWIPTGYSFAAGAIPAVVGPWNEYGAYCVNCHASAVSESTFSTLNNVLTEGVQYRALPATQICRQDLDHIASKRIPQGEVPHVSGDEAESSLPPTVTFPAPRSAPLPGWEAFYDGEAAKAAATYQSTFPHRLPGQTWDHRPRLTDDGQVFQTSDQCQGCHDATYSNSRTPNMMFEERRIATDGSSDSTLINLSPYSEWSASPMGLAGRDPIFFSQLQSETNHLPDLAACIETTCLHCHGVMGQRQLGIDTEGAPDGQACKELFGIEPPPGVAFGEPLRRAVIDRFPGDGVAGHDPDLTYAGLARDGISCTVCHRISETALGEERSNTGNWVPGPTDALYGPFDDPLNKPMEHALGITPALGEQTTSSALCAVCHDILLPTFDERGQPVPDPGQPGKQLFSYEQSTALEWGNSVYGRAGEDFHSCQDCHMPGSYAGVPLNTRIANIEDASFAFTENRLPDEDLKLPIRAMRRHSLHGLNLFLNAFFQQFPVLLGKGQVDYMTGTAPRAALLTGQESMLSMAREETAGVTVALKPSAEGVEAQVTVQNHVGHFLPSGVGFRRVLLEVVVKDANGQPVWASGRTNGLGVVVAGLGETPLPSERPWEQEGEAQWQPHYEVITSQEQAQIYQEVNLGCDGRVNTSFLRRCSVVKDNRLRPRGFDPAVFAASDSPYVRALAEHGPRTPEYRDPTRTGTDTLLYRVALPDGVARPVRVEASLYSQSIPPAYLAERFRDASVGPAEGEDIERLWYLTSHLNTAAPSVAGEPMLEGYKLRLATGAASM